MVDADRHRGRPPRRWVDDVVDWCGRPLPEVVRLTPDSEEWRSVVTGLNGSQVCHGHETELRFTKKKKKRCKLTVAAVTFIYIFDC